jgi:hypothetical protein
LLLNARLCTIPRRIRIGIAAISILSGEKMTDEPKQTPENIAYAVARKVADVEMKYSDHLRWDRTANNQLYYALWIVFGVGFVMSINGSVQLGDLSLGWKIGIWVFRFTGIVGMALNFYQQNMAIDIVSLMVRRMGHYELHLIHYEAARKYETANAIEKMSTEEERARKEFDEYEKIPEKMNRYSEKCLPRLECATKCVAAFFLALAFILTLNVFPKLQAGKEENQIHVQQVLPCPATVCECNPTTLSSSAPPPATPAARSRTRASCTFVSCPTRSPETR